MLRKNDKLALYFVIFNKKCTCELAIKSIEILLRRCYYLDKRLRKTIQRGFEKGAGEGD